MAEDVFSLILKFQKHLFQKFSVLLSAISCSYHGKG